MQHKSVLLDEVIDSLKLTPGMTVLDGTLGSGGHAKAIIDKIGSEGRLIAMDQDAQAIERSRQRLKDHDNIDYCHANFSEAEQALERLNVPFLNAVILDVGCSSEQLDTDERGFSFDKDGPLDMRMNQDQDLTAYDLVNDLSQDQLETIFRDYGEDRLAKRYARRICEDRRQKRISTTKELAEVILRATPYKKPPPGKKKMRGKRKHPATRVFQALRIAVNEELDVLRTALPMLWNRLAVGGRMAVISFHSLEDRIVKYYFREQKQAKLGTLIFKKPVVPKREEVLENARSRSAKLRVIERIDEGNG